VRLLPPGYRFLCGFFVGLSGASYVSAAELAGAELVATEILVGDFLAAMEVLDDSLSLA